jgi:hypothetical protein
LSQNPVFHPLVDKKIRKEGFHGYKAFFYAIWDPKKGQLRNEDTVVSLL